MPILPISFHYCGIYFQSLCKKPKLKKGQRKNAQVSTKNEKIYGSQESLLSSVDGSESTTTEISSEQSAISTETSGICSQVENMIDKDNEVDVAGSNELDTVDPKVSEQAKKDLSANDIVAEMEKKQQETHRKNLSKAKIFVILLLVSNIPGAMYFSLIHQRGTVLVLKYIHDNSLEGNIAVLFLMPCHSTPYYR